MKINTIEVLPAKREHFNMFKYTDDSSCKLEFVYNGLGENIKYCEQDLGVYETNNRDQLILDFFEALADYNNGDSQSVKAKLDQLVEVKSPVINQQYQTIFKNNVLKYLIGLEDNIIKSACIEQKLTYQQLADAIGVSESSLRSSVSTNKVSKQIEKSIEMYLRIVYLEKELEKTNLIKSTLKSWLS